MPRACPNYGWYFPAPGKTREDYEEDRQRVQNLIAADIISEHEVHEDDEEPMVFQGSRPKADRKAAALTITCSRCGQGPGQRCTTAAGDYTELHKVRVDSAPPGI